ncbi:MULTISPECIES: PrsW family glutamic-type intramembrane protease [unclassified Okeania]|uniref:PrsW family glutamic-type intramembrane protease n=1 Tax=unclassified Okeania TaxID=2634635 RepID=UPI0013B74193|nr:MULTISPECIES: PrsW family glutamic-type intramembrane protease [unclassified Okeania]NES74642.1 PrsW family intramembrane metalloprotease [Okeania sp. SIO1H4]NET21951.1 PrsW family intramembrane metalloprotease [Okeania sp. SIO1H5]NET93080.1 PrsW family intramembrane metalloprotease [Okeania sp. SIO1H2]
MAFLRQLSTRGVYEEKLIKKYLSEIEEIVLGRDPKCQIVLETKFYTTVSRRHALIRIHTKQAKTTGLVWEICDLNSSNGTYINGRRIQGSQILQVGDRIRLGYKGPEFIFDNLSYQKSTLSVSQSVNSTSLPVNSVPNVEDVEDTESITLTQLFPIASTGKQLAKKAYLYPGIITVFFVILMFLTVGRAIAFNFLLAAYIATAAYYFVYQLCGKQKPWWVLFGVALTTVIILLSPILTLFIGVFRFILPGDISVNPEQVGFLDFLIRMFFGAGLMEELLKALPVFLALLIGRNLPDPWRNKIGVWEPLDGILLGTASAVGFTLLETLGQYVPSIVDSASLQLGVDAGQLVGLQLLIPRILGSVAGHMAYSGYFGYFIGLSVLRRRNSWLILGVGYLTASILHALWNASGVLNIFLLAFVGVISYAFLGAAILKARVLSPTRNENFATQVLMK